MQEEQTESPDDPRSYPYTAASAGLDRPEVQGSAVLLPADASGNNTHQPLRLNLSGRAQGGEEGAGNYTRPGPLAAGAPLAGWGGVGWGGGQADAWAWRVGGETDKLDFSLQVVTGNRSGGGG